MKDFSLQSHPLGWHFHVVVPNFWLSYTSGAWFCVSELVVKLGFMI